MVALDKDLQSRQLARELVRNAKNAQLVYAKFSQENRQYCKTHCI